ncbi:MAG: hypothetical protein AB1421_00775 [Pseudomonadota bacterium]
MKKIVLGVLGLVFSAQAIAQAAGAAGMPYVPLWVLQPQPQWVPLPLAMPQGGTVQVLPPRQVPYPTPFWMWYVPGPAPASVPAPAPRQQPGAQVVSPAAAGGNSPGLEQKSAAPTPVTLPNMDAALPTPTSAGVEPAALQPAAKEALQPGPAAYDETASAIGQPVALSEPEPAPALVPVAKARTAVKQRSNASTAAATPKTVVASPAKAGKAGNNGKKSRKLCWMNGRLDVCD